MDYHKLKRRELQALCKKHGIPANLKNVEMADSLSSLLKEENPMKRVRSCLKNVVVLSDGDDEETVDCKEPKRVKFSPQNETFVFDKTDPREARLLARKRRVLRKPEIKENPVVIDDVALEEPVVRVLRRRSIVVKPDAVSGTGGVDGRGDLGRNLRSRRKDTSVDERVLSQCVEKKAKRGRKGQAVEEVVQEKHHEIEQVIKKGRKGRKMTKAIKEQEVKRGEEVGVEDLMEENGGDDKISKSRQEVLSKVDASSREQVVDDGKVHGMTAQYVNQLVAKVRTGYVQDKETLPSVSAPEQSLSESCEQKSDGETALSGSMAEESHKVIPRRDLTYFAKDSNMAVTFKQPEEAYCFDDITNDAQRKELESDRENQTSEEDLLATGGEVKKNVLFHIRNSANLTSEWSTLHYDVPSSSNEIECIAFVSNPCHPVKDLEHMTVEDAEDTDDSVISQGENSVFNLKVQNCKSAVTSDFEYATSCGDCNETSKSSPIKETIVPVSELESSERGDETNTDLKSSSCNSPVESMENETPKVCHSQDSSPFTAQEATNIRLEIDYCTAQSSRSADSVEMNVEAVSICGNESPIYAICNKPDEALGLAFSQQPKFSGSVQKGFENFDEEAGSVEGATGQDANSGEKKSFNSISEREFGEAVERGLPLLSSMLVAVSEEGISDVGDEIVKGCSRVGINPVNSCSGHVEMDEKSGSPMRYSGKGDAALGLDNNTGSIVGEPEFPVRDDETNADMKSNSCNIHVEPVENETPQASHSRDSSPFTAQETTNIRLEIVDCTAQTSRSANSAEMIVGGVSICGNESPKSTIRNELDEALGQAFSQQTKSSGPVQKEFECFDEEAGSVEGAIGQGTNSGEKNSFKSKSEREFGEAVERELAVQSSMLVAVSEEGKSDVGDKVVKGCSMVGINPVNRVGNGKDSDSCSGHLETNEMNGSQMRSSGTKLLGDAALGLDYDRGNIVVACPPSVNRKSSCYSTDACAGTSEIASDSLQISQENLCNEILQNANNDIEELKSGEHMLVKDDQYDKGDKVEPDAENSDALPSVTPAKIVSQASVSKMYAGPESIAEKSLVGNASTGEMDLQNLIEGVDRNNKAADIAEPRENVNSALVGSLSFSKNGTGFGDVEEALECTPEEQIDCQMNAGNSTGQENVKEEKTDCYLNSVQEDTSMNENDNSTSSGPEGSDSLPGDMGNVSDGDINIVHEKLINCEAELEFNAGEGNCMSGQRIITQSHEDGYMDPVQKDACMTEKYHKAKEGSSDLESSPCGIYTMNFVPEYTVDKESRSPAYIDYTGEFSRDAQENRGSSVEKDPYIIPFTSPLTDATSSESQIAMHKFLDSTCSQNFIDTSGLHEMALEVPSNHLFTHLEMDDGYRIGNSEQKFEDAEYDTTYVGRASNPPSSICENKRVNASEEIVVGCAVRDFIALSNSMEEHDKVAAEHISRDSENGDEWDGNDNDASDNKVDADSSSPEVSENFTDQPQEQNHTPSISSYQQMDLDPIESACQPGSNTTIVLETEDVKSKFESSLLTDSEIDLFWREIEKDEVRELPIIASGVTMSVAEYEIANVENDTDSTHQPTVGDNSWLDEQTLEEGKGMDIEGRGESATENGDEQKCKYVKEIENSLIRRNNTRSILIHGTPQKPPYFMHDMKENAAAPKSLQMVGATVVKRRKALEDISK